ncbi:hypothetical protein ACFPRL_04385 [Pseudoclavibacter helvolus]
MDRHARRHEGVARARHPTARGLLQVGRRTVVPCREGASPRGSCCLFSRDCYCVFTGSRVGYLGFLVSPEDLPVSRLPIQGSTYSRQYSELRGRWMLGALGPKSGAGTSSAVSTLAATRRWPATPMWRRSRDQ